MRFQPIFFFVLLSLVLTTVSCKKELTTEELLQAKPWQLIALTVDPPLVNTFPPSTIVDVYATYDACKKDDLLTFLDQSFVVFDEGKLKCNPASPQTRKTTYSLNSTSTIVTIDGVDRTIVSVTGDELIMTYKSTIGTTVYTFTEKYK